jgi:N-acetylmuramoyl-L-alanine amidase
VARLIWAASPTLFLFFAPFVAHAARPFRVVIDPGHGGNDHGAVYEAPDRTVMEKDATLLLAQDVAQQLKTRGIEVTLTRDEDEDVPLGMRTGIANKIKADAFVSIHMNSTPDPAIVGSGGIETYILNNTTDETSRRLAHLENTILSPEVRASNSPEEVDVALILRDLRLDANLSESKRLACTVQSHLIAYAPETRNRGVKQALFHVLLGAEMPSILVEAGFINNAHDRAQVLNPRSRKILAAAIARSIETFRDAKGTLTGQSTLSRCKVH